MAYLVSLASADRLVLVAFLEAKVCKAIMEHKEMLVSKVSPVQSVLQATLVLWGHLATKVIVELEESPGPKEPVVLTAKLAYGVSEATKVRRVSEEILDQEGLMVHQESKVNLELKENLAHGDWKV